MFPISNTALIIIAISQVFVLIWVFRKKNKNDGAPSPAVSEKYPYESMRDMAINAAPGAMLLSLPENETGVYGVVMDWEMSDDYVTLVAYITGDASLYVKSGGAIIGGGMHKNVALAAQNWVAMTQPFIAGCAPATTTPLPDKNAVRFYLLTNRGKFGTQVWTAQLEDNSSAWAPVFANGQKVIAALQSTVTTQP